MEKEVNVKVSAATGELKIFEEVRTGQLPAIKELITLIVLGNIMAPVQYLGHMDAIKEAERDTCTPIIEGFEYPDCIDRSLTHALVNLKTQKIRLFVNKNKEYNQGYQAIVSGQLMLSGDLDRFDINEEAEMSPRKMADKLKRLKIFFKDPNENREIVNALMNLVGKTSKDFTRAEDNRGTLKTSIDKKVTTNLPETFTLCLPLFEGFAPMTFQVEIGVDDRDGGLSVWLESTELFSLLIELRDSVIHAEVEKLEKAGILVIIENPDSKG